MSTLQQIRLALGLASLMLATAPAEASTLGISFTELPLAQTRSAHASFYFNATGASEYACALDGGEFQSCRSPHTVFGLQTGAHRMQIRASDASGNTGPVAEVTWDQLDPFAGSHPDLIATTQQPSPVAPNSWRGILRINCDLSHAAYEDPIVYPGAALRAHLHKFYGLLNAGPDTSVAALYRASGDADGKVSSCQGNDLNRSSYWAPALLAPTYDDLGARQVDTNGDPAFDVVPAVVGNDDVAHEVFYYSAGVDDLDSIQPIPQGLVMIAGDMRATPESPQSSSIARWHCQTWESSDSGNPNFSATIPECAEPDRLRADIFFPSCWNGVDLDSADHKSHMAYPESANGRLVCPASHPVPVVRVSYHYAFPVKPENSEPSTRSSRGWQLASDMYVVSSERPGGASLHGDWMNGWHPEVMQAIVDVCIRGGLDCHDGNLGNGFRLSGTTAGSGAIPDFILEGMGPAHTELPSLSVSDITLTPPASGGVASFELKLSQPMTSALSIRVRTEDITAKAGIDYQPLADTFVTLAAGQTRAQVDVPLLSQPDATRRQFALWIDAADDVLVADGYAVGELNAGVASDVPAEALLSSDQYLWMVPAASNTEQQGFVRLINHENRSGQVTVWGIDAAGNRSSGTITLTLSPQEARQFNSQDIEQGNTDKGLSGSLGSGNGHWTIVVRTDLDIETLAYIRTPDGFLTSMHDRVDGDGVDWQVPIFNPAENTNQVSQLRLINSNTSAVNVQISGIDDAGVQGASAVTLTLAGLSSLDLSATDLENGNASKGLLGHLGDGSGKWRLQVSSTGRLTVQSLLYDPLGKLTNLSTLPDLTQTTPDQHILWMLPPASNTAQQGFIRLINRENRAGTVTLRGVDDAGQLSPGTASFSLAANASAQFNSQDLELGNASKGLSGSLGDGSGNWRLLVTTDLDLWPMALIRTPDGFLTTVHEVVAGAGTDDQVLMFNPASNPNQASSLRLVNPNTVASMITLEGLDDAGLPGPGGSVTLELAAGAATELTATDLESGNTGRGLSGALGDGNGKWRLSVSATAPVRVMSLLTDPNGFLTNLSRGSKNTDDQLDP